MVYAWIDEDFCPNVRKIICANLQILDIMHDENFNVMEWNIQAYLFMKLNETLIVEVCTNIIFFIINGALIFQDI